MKAVFICGSDSFKTIFLHIAQNCPILTQKRSFMAYLDASRIIDISRGMYTFPKNVRGISFARYNGLSDYCRTRNSIGLAC